MKATGMIVSHMYRQAPPRESVFLGTVKRTEYSFPVRGQHVSPFRSSCINYLRVADGDVPHMRDVST